jgi:flavorubredoxin
MKTIVIYDTVSEAKVTGKVAETIVSCLTANGVPVDSYFVEDVAKANLKEYDCIIVGAPTMAWKPSTRMKGFLDGLKGNPISGNMAATFDTQLKSAISGNATKHMEKHLKDLGMNIIVPALLAYVETKDKKYQLREGETQHIMTWCKELAKALTPKS